MIRDCQYKQRSEGSSDEQQKQPFLSGVCHCFQPVISSSTKHYGTVKCKQECAFPFLPHSVDVRKGMSALTGGGREKKRITSVGFPGPQGCLKECQQNGRFKPGEKDL